MKKLLIFLLFLNNITFGQSSQPQRAMYGTKAEVRRNPGLAGMFIIPNFGTRTHEVFMKDQADTTSPESDSVIVSTSGVRFKRLSPTTVTAVASAAWGSITGKPSTFAPAAHTQAISTITNLESNLAAKQDTIGSGATNQILTWGRVWRTADKSWFGLNNVPNIDATNASNLGSGSIPAARFGLRTIPNTAIAQSGATDGQTIKWSTSLNAWVPAADNSSGTTTWGGLSGSLSSQTDLQSALDAKAAATRNITAGTGLTGGGTLAADRTISIANDGVTNSKLENMTQRTIKGRADGAGTGDPTDIDMLALPVSTATQTEITKRIAHKTIAEVRAFTVTDVTNNPAVFITDAGKEGEFRYVAGSSKSDNTGTVLVSGSYRYERVVKDNTYRADWFKISGDAHTGLAIRRAINVAIAALANDSNAVVNIGKGRNTVDTTYILLNVPKWRRLVIQGEAGNIVDFYSPESPGAVFRTNPTPWETDSTYNYGNIEIRDVNFIGNRNPFYTPPNASVGVRPIWIGNVQSIKISNCSFRNIYGSAMAIGWSRMIAIESNNIENVYARQPNDPDATGDAISIYARCKNIVVANNILQLRNGLLGRCGISVDDRSVNFVVSGNIVQGYERGLHIEHCRDGIVSENVVTRSPIAGISSINRNVIWANNIFDSEKSVSTALLGAPGTFIALTDTNCIYRGNTFRNWTGQSGSYFVRFWGNDLIIESNIFEPNRNDALVWGYGGNLRNRFIGNQFRGKINLNVALTTGVSVERNEFWGGTVIADNTTDVLIENNTFRPNVGDNTGLGINVYNSTRPFVTGNKFYNPASYCIENGATTNAIFENNTFFRTHANAAGNTYFYVNTGISATGVKKTAPDRYNVIRDYLNNETYYIGNTGTPTAY